MSNFETTRLHSVPKAVFCDLDGTLADSLAFLYEVYAEFMRQHGFEATKEEFQTLVGPPISEVVEILQRKYPFTDHHTELYRRYVNLFRYYSERIPLMPGAKEFIEHGKKKGTLFYIVTAASRSYAERFIKSHDLDQYFEAAITLEDAPFSKPHPAPYQKALEISKISPHEVVTIEDSSSGVASSTSAGIKTFWLTPHQETSFIEWRGDICQVQNWKVIQELVYGT